MRGQSPASLARQTAVAAAIAHGEKFKDIADAFGMSIGGVSKVGKRFGLRRVERSNRRRELTPDRLREVLDYDPASGWFTWRENHRMPALRGARAGGVGPSTRGYRYICVDGRIYQAHRLAWLYVYGCWPSNKIDHRNLEHDDNAIANLRDATDSQSAANRRASRSNAVGLKGVTLIRPGHWRARITVNHRQINLGRFRDPEAAHAAYADAARQHFGEFARAA